VRLDNHLNPRRDEKSRYCCGMADVVDTRFKVESTGAAYPRGTRVAHPRKRRFGETQQAASINARLTRTTASFFGFGCGGLLP
jgi:hypothetical protein